MADSNFVNPYERIWKTRDLRQLEAKPIELENNLSSFERGLGRFGQQMQGTGYGLAALASQGVQNVIGENPVTQGITDWGLKGYNEAMAKSQPGAYYAPKIAGVEDIKSPSDALEWGAGMLGEQLPLAASLMLTGGVGGAVARLGANTAVKDIAKAAVGTAVKKGVEQGALKAAEGQLVTDAMRNAASKALLDTTLKGAATTAFMGTAGLEGGLSFGETVQGGAAPADAVKTAIAVGGINGALELLTPYVIAKRMGMGDYAKNSIKEIIKTNPDLSKRAVAIAKELGTRAAKGSAEGAVTEGITEGLQELTSIAGERWAKNDPLFADLTEQDWSRIKNASAGGLFVGGALSGAGATLSGPQQVGPTTQPPTGTSPAAGPQTQPPTGATTQIRAQALDSLRSRVDTELEAAQKRGDTKRVQELQEARDILVANQERIVEEAPTQEAPVQEPVAQEPVAQEPSTQEAPVIPTHMPPTQEIPAQETPTNTPSVDFDEQGIFEHTFTENEIPTVVVSGRYDEEQKELYIKRIDKNPNLREKKGLGVEALQSLIADAELQRKPVDKVTAEASESFVKSLKRSPFADRLTVTDIPGIKEKDVVIDLKPSKLTQPIEETANAQEVQAQTEVPVVKVSPLVEEMFQAGTQSVDELRSRIDNVRSGPIISGKDTIEFTLDGKSYTGFMEGRNRDLVVSNDNSDTDKAVAARVLLDGKAEIKSGAPPLQPRDSVIQGQPLFSKQVGKQKTVTPEMDAEYLAAVEREDMEAAQRIVDEAAKKAGYTINAYHGTPVTDGFTEFKDGHEAQRVKGIYFTKNPVEARKYTKRNGKIDSGPVFSVRLQIKNPAYRSDLDKLGFGHDGEANRQELIKQGFDGLIDDYMDEIVVFNPDQIKLTNPITYDNAGNIIPLSQRFNATTPDIRYTQQPDTTNIPLQDFHSNINSIMGDGWLQQATEVGLVEVIEGKGPNGEAGSWAGDHIRLYTGSMPKDGSPAGVLLHEGKHATFKDILGDSLSAYVKDLHVLAKNGNKVAQDAITHAVIAAADSMGIKHNLYDGGTKSDFDAVRALIEEKYPGLLSEEELAYFVQHGAESQTGQGFLRRLINAIKSWLMQTRLGQRAKELGIGFELTDGMAVEWAKMGLNRSLQELKQAAKIRARVEKQAAVLPASARLGKALGALEDFDPLYSFVGENALTANLSLQREAELRIKNGEDKESVRQDTGWFLNEADGKWRFEIDDSKAKLQFPFDEMPESELFKPEQAILLEDFLDHPDLFAAYPQLKKISVIKRVAFMDLDHRTQGWFNDANLQIGITPYAENPMSTLLHEIQHVIQMYEGFARGGNENSVWAALPKETKENIAKNLLNKVETDLASYQEKLNFLNQIESSDNIKHYLDQYISRSSESDRLWESRNAFVAGSEEFYRANTLWMQARTELEEADKKLSSLLGVNRLYKLNIEKYSTLLALVRGEKINERINAAQVELVKLLDKRAKIQSGDEKTIRNGANLYEFYRRLAGETEARLTQARQGMTGKERISKSPESMQEYPYNEQIVVMPGTKTSGEVFYSMGIQELRQQLWTDPTDINQELVNKPGLLQRLRGNFIDFFADMEKKSKDIYDTYSLLRSKKAGRIEQARQEYYFPLRELIAKSPWSAKEMGDMLAARHIKVDKVNTRLAERASYGFTKDLLKALPKTKQKELQQARVNIKAGKMPDGSDYVDANGNKIDMAATTKQKLMFDLMNKYVQHEITDTNGRQVLREEWELFKDAAGGFSNGGVGKTKVRTIDDVLQMADRDRAKFDEIANLFDALNRHTLDILEEGGLITAKEHARLLADKSAYAPLRRESYNVNREIELLFQKAGQGGSKQVSTRTGTAALSEPALVLQNALAATEAAAAAAERNLANKELYKVIVADREGWKPWFTIVEKDKYVTHDEDGFLQEKHATASNRADITLINDGKKLVIRPNMHNERAMGFVRAVNNLDAQILSGPMQVLGWVNQIVRWVNVSASPVFLMMNAVRDPFTALYNIQASKAGEYTKEIFNPKTYKDSFKALKKVFMDGNRDPNDKDVQWVERWELAGGRTSFVETLREMDDTWRSFDAQVARRQGNMKQLMRVKDKWIDGIENFNILFENVMRFSTFKVLIEKGVSEKEAARISQDLTTNFTRRGYKTQMLGTWWLFFNATVQGNYQVLRNLMGSKKVQAMVGGTIVLGLLLDLLGRAIADDWDKIPEWDKERFIILPLKVGGDFIKIPAPWVYNVVWRTGGLLGEALSGVKKPQDAVLDIAAMTATTFNPLGKPGSIAQAIAPTAADPFVQILENKDFSGNPLGPEGFPGAGSKANSELLWSSTPKGYQSIARWVNEFTGGSAVESGMIDLRPADYQLLARFLTGSLGRFMSDATFGVKEALDKGIEGPRDIPVIKEIFSDPYDPLKSQKYHTNIAGIYGAHKLEQMYLRGPDRDLIKLQEVRKNRGEELRMYTQAQDVERQLKSLRVRLRAAQNREDREREKEIKNRMGKIQERFNERYQQRMG